jgi:omega-6 fatty acid desaturase (delta-12 desaturase)
MRIAPPPLRVFTTALVRPSAGEVRRALGTGARRPSALKGTGLFLLSLLSYLAALLGVIALPWWPARLLCAALSAAPLGTLLLVGHDAAHGSLTPWPLLNAVLGRLAFLPSFHPYTPWKVAHDRLHHDFTNLRGYDFVWAPLSKDEFDHLPTLGRLLQRMYRTAWGVGLYYVVEVWLKHAWRKRDCYRPRDQYGVAGRLDQFAVVAFGVAQAAALCAAHGWIAQRYGLPALSPPPLLAVALVLPFLLVCWAGGFAAFLHHTHPRARWYADRAEWSFVKGNLEGTTHIAFPWPINHLLHGLMDHAAHHVDRKVPLYRLADVQKGLEATYPAVITEKFSVRAFRRTLAVCQLYDYANHRWLAFDGTPTT